MLIASFNPGIDFAKLQNRKHFRNVAPPSGDVSD